MTVKRLFIAVDIKPEPEFADIVESLKNDLTGELIKWVGTDVFHLTLKFLGDTDTIKVDPIKKILGKISAEFETFGCKIRGLGYFGSPRDPKVLFAGIDGAEPLAAISREINTQLSLLGIEPELKEFKAHLTLGRIKSVSNKKFFIELIKAEKGVYYQKSLIDLIILYESILRPQGPQYIALAKFRLGK